MTNPTEKYLDRAVADNGVIELRHLPTGKSGLFNHAGLLLTAARSLAGAGNLYITLNRPQPVVAGNVMGTPALGNDDIQFQTRLLFDFDPDRETNTASDADELKLAEEMALACRDHHRALGWPDPLIAMSGNGYHLLYRTHLPNTGEIREQLRWIYKGHAEEFGTEDIKFDKSVRNPGRICTLYGSVKRKGPNTPERPHRQSVIISWPRDWRQVPRHLVEATANIYAAGSHVDTSSNIDLRQFSRVTGSGDYTTLDVVAWFTAHDLYEHHIEANIHAVICPWERLHSNSNPNDTTIYTNPGRWPGFHCQHDHCEGRNIRDVIDLLEDADVFCARSWEGHNHV